MGSLKLRSQQERSSKDGMDQSKWTIPRLGKKQSSDLMKNQEPRLKLQAVWVHNIALHFFLIDPRVDSDSSMVVDCLAKAIEHAVNKCADRDCDIRHCMVWAAEQQKSLCDSIVPSISGIGIKCGKNPHCHLCPSSEADNTTRENKNNTLLHYLCHLISRNKLDASSLMMSRVGHTHGCVGCSDALQVFSLRV